METTHNAIEKSSDFQKVVTTLLVDIREILLTIKNSVDKDKTEYADQDLVDLAITLLWRHGPNHAKIAEIMTKQTNRKIYRTGLMKNKIYEPYREVYERLSNPTARRGFLTDDEGIDAAI